MVLSCLQTVLNILRQVLPKDHKKAKSIQVPISSDYYAKRIAGYRSASKILKLVGFKLGRDTDSNLILHLRFVNGQIGPMIQENVKTRVICIRTVIEDVVETFKIDRDKDELKSDFQFRK